MRQYYRNLAAILYMQAKSGINLISDYILHATLFIFNSIHYSSLDFRSKCDKNHQYFKLAAMLQMQSSIINIAVIIHQYNKCKPNLIIFLQ